MCTYASVDMHNVLVHIHMCTGACIIIEIRIYMYTYTHAHTTSLTGFRSSNMVFLQLSTVYQALRVYVHGNEYSDQYILRNPANRPGR